MNADIEALRQATLDDVNEFPVEIRDDWLGYFERTVADMWSRPAMSPRNRSIITIAALTTMRSTTELRAQVRVALRHGLSRQEVCEVVMQVGGYGGLGRATEALRVVRTAFDDEPDLRPEGRNTDTGLPPAADDRERLIRAHETMSVLRPGGVEHILAMLDSEISGVRKESDREPSGWFHWLNMTAFGDLWKRPYLTIDERERATIATLTVLGLGAELRPHFTISLNVGIPPEEIIEMLLHLAVYAGFPTMVDAAQIADAVIAEHAQGKTPSVR